MKNFTVKQLKKMWIDFFENHNHTQIQGSSLVPENDASVLFTTAGMQPLVPYLLGKPHPQGKRLFNVQRCLRTNDIDSVGDENHFTFFEMLGNWSLGDYFKEEAIKNSFEFLTSEKYLGIPLNRLAVTVFEGDEDAPRDEESASIWQKVGMPKEQIFYFGKENNWWSAGETGPCGPDTEMFYVTNKPACGPNCSPACDCGHYVEIGNNVFMQYVVKNAGEKPQLLDQKNVDTGMGLERNVAALNGFESAYDIDVMHGAIEVLESISTTKYKDSEKSIKAYRIIVDHMRASTFILGDEHRVLPSNVGQGYVLRRLIRRAITYSKNIGADVSKLDMLVDYFVNYYEYDTPILRKNRDDIILDLDKEIKKFSNTINAGMKEFEKAMRNIQNNVLGGDVAFRLHDTFGFPVELTEELAKERGVAVDIAGYKAEVEKHQQISRANVKDVFKGGLSGQGEMETKYHTCTHIVLQTLKRMFGNQVEQRGSNITPERMRFDFNLDHKMTNEEKIELEKRVNEIIDAKLPVTFKTMTPQEAHQIGAIGIFDNKYGNEVTVYYIGDYDVQICGGPHVKNTGELGHFKLQKEESCSAGIRRIKGVLE